MQGAELYLIFAAPLEALGIQYMVTGSVASIVYGEPRMTHDIDMVVDLGAADLSRFAQGFPLEQFYCPPDETLRVETARTERGHFNLIHHDSGFKADMFLKGSDPLHEWAFERKRAVQLPSGGRLWVAPPEYVILRKLEFFTEGGSDKHLRDIAGILQVSGDDLDREALEEWIARLGLAEVWQRISSGP